MSFICLKIFEEVRFFVLKNVPSTGFRAGTHNPLAVDHWPVRNWATQQEVSSQLVSKAAWSGTPHHSIYHLNHSPLPLPSCVEKLSSTKLVPGARKAGDCCHGAQINMIVLSLLYRPQGMMWYTEIDREICCLSMNFT